MTESTNGGSTNGGSNGGSAAAARVGTDRVKQGLAQMLKGGVIVRWQLACLLLLQTLDATLFSFAKVRLNRSHVQSLVLVDGAFIVVVMLLTPWSCSLKLFVSYKL
jgi:hypothetical protein